MEKNGHGLNSEELERIRNSLKRGSRYQIFANAPLELDKEECRPLSRDSLSNMRYGGQITEGHAYVLYAVYTLGHATPNMVHNLLSCWKNYAGKKAISSMPVDFCKGVLSTLGKRGLVMSQKYRADNHMIHVYTITSYGFSLVRAMLGMDDIPYDMSAMYRCDKEVFKILAVNAVTVEMGSVLGSPNVLVNGRFGGFGRYPDLKGYLYGAVEDGETLYVLEPAYFVPDERIETELESTEKVGKRLLKIAGMCDTFEVKYQKKVRLLFVVENATGASKLVDLLHGMDDPKGRYRSGLITCENLFYASRGEMKYNFLRWSCKDGDDGLQKRLMPVGEGWR